MKEYITNLFKDAQPWRVEMFIDKMKDLKKDATINEVASFAMEARDIATKILDDKFCKCTQEPMWTVGSLCVTCNKPQKK